MLLLSPGQTPNVQIESQATFSTERANNEIFVLSAYKVALCIET